jgi:hypothetical protein
VTGAGPVVPDLPGLRTILDAAHELGGPIGTTVELCILCAALPFEVLAIQLENIDWPRGIVTVPTRGCRAALSNRDVRHLGLSNPAIQTIMKAAGSINGRGQAVTAGRGEPLKPELFRLDRVVRQLAKIDPAVLSVGWNFHGIRVAIAETLSMEDVPHERIEMLLYGRVRELSRFGPVPYDVASIAERWWRTLRQAAPPRR